MRFTHEFKPITLQDIVRYAGASGDFNPNHYDERRAKNLGYQTNFAQGMFTAGLLGVVITERFRDFYVARFGVRFLNPLWCEDAPVAVVDSTQDQDNNLQLEAMILVEKRTVLKGWATLKRTRPADVPT